MNNSTGANTGSADASIPSLTTILGYQSGQPSGYDVTTHTPAVNLSANTAAPDDGDDKAWVIAVGVVVPLVIVIIAVIIFAYIIYRRKYPVRMIIGREFLKVRNPNYDRPVSSATLVREDAEVYFSTRTERLSGISDIHEFNPVIDSLNYDNMGYQRDEDERGDDEEDTADEEFRKRKKWLFKNPSENEDDTYENYEVKTKGKSGNSESNNSESEISDIEAMFSKQQITPRQKRKLKGDVSSSSDEDKYKSDSNVSVYSQDSETKSEEESQHNSKVQNGLEVSFEKLHLDETFAQDPKSTRSQSLTISTPNTDVRPRSFSVDPLKSARKFSLRSELFKRAGNGLDTPDSAVDSLSANIVGVIVRTSGSTDSLASSFLSGRANSFTSLNSLNSNPHLVTDLDESDQTDDSVSGVDKNLGISIDIKSRDKDLEPSAPEYENLEDASKEAVVLDQGDQHDEVQKKENDQEDISNMAGIKSSNIEKPEDIKIIPSDSTSDSNSDTDSYSSRESRDGKTKTLHDLTKVVDPSERLTQVAHDDTDGKDTKSTYYNKNDSIVLLTTTPSSSITASTETQDIDKTVDVLKGHRSQTHEIEIEDATSAIYENNSIFETNKRGMVQEEATVKVQTHQNDGLDSGSVGNPASLEENLESKSEQFYENNVNIISEINPSSELQSTYDNIVSDGDLYLNIASDEAQKVNTHPPEDIHQASDTDTDDNDKDDDDDDDGSSSEDSGSSTSKSSTDGYYQNYSFVNEDLETPDEQDTVSKGMHVSHLEPLHTMTEKTSGSSPQRELATSGRANQDAIIDTIKHHVTSQVEEATGLRDLIYENTRARDVPQTQQLEHISEDFPISSKVGGGMKEKSQGKKENLEWFREQYENLDFNKETETKHQLHSSDDDKESSISSNFSNIEDVSDSDLEDPADHDSKRQPHDANISYGLKGNLGQIYEHEEELESKWEQTGSLQTTPSRKEDIVPRSTSESRVKIIPTLHFSEGSSDSENSDSGAMPPPINLENHPYFNSGSLDKQVSVETENENGFSLDDINDALYANEGTLHFAHDDSTKQNSEEQNDLSFSFQTLRSNKDIHDDDIDV